MADLKEQIRKQGSTISDEKAAEYAFFIRQMLVGNVISEYGMLGFKDQTKQDLRNRVNKAILAVRYVQEHFTRNNHQPELRKIFEKQLNSNQMVLIASICANLWGLDEDSLENIDNQLKQAIDAEQRHNNESNSGTNAGE